ILDDGRVTDAKGRTIDFRHAILVLTSNLDREELEATLRPELIDRIDEIVVFKELGSREIEQIVTLQVALLAERLGAHAMRLDLSETARGFLAKESSAQGSGARYVARAIARHVTTPLSDAILRGRLAGGHTARVDYDGRGITVEAAA
ncbi:MAG: ATP-dependent Clp protease ATP-binding subunit ClpC, partial [Candidatus Eremiobacteraeota bacterium]|nr:ATP-dependent Clp protease ATP-binding subunit ClpC [Candidatus Eremiobacteraeota bacterium]